jgi:hypothetical protein
VRGHQVLPTSWDTLKGAAPLPDGVTVHLDAGYYQVPAALTRAERGTCLVASPPAGTPVLFQVGQRWVVERTNPWANNFGKLCCCIKRRGRAVEAKASSSMPPPDR